MVSLAKDHSLITYDVLNIAASTPLTKSDPPLLSSQVLTSTSKSHRRVCRAPVLSPTGDQHAARVGLSILTRIGLEEFIALSPEKYMEFAVQWASDLPRLADI